MNPLRRRAVLRFRLSTLIVTVLAFGGLLASMLHSAWPFHKTDDCSFMETDAWNMLVFPLNALSLLAMVTAVAVITEKLQGPRN